MTILEAVRTAIARLKQGRHSKSYVILGQRGSAKSRMIQKVQSDCGATEDAHICVVSVVDPNDFLQLLVSQFRQALLALTKQENALALASRGLCALNAFNATHPPARLENDSASADHPPEPGLSDSGVLETDLAELICCIGSAAKACGAVVVLCIDNLDLVETNDLSALIASIHQLSQRGLPLLLVCTALPAVRMKIGNAKPYAERMFEYVELERSNA